MLIVYLFTSAFYVVGQCETILPSIHLKNDHQLIQCITSILNTYFSERKVLTYVNMDFDDDELLKTIHSTHAFLLISRHAINQTYLPNRGYFVLSNNATTFAKNFEYLLMEPAWNPYVRFLIVIKSLEDNDLRIIFDLLLKTRVIHALVVNGTVDAHLYTYNPFDNYTCGKYYSDVISYGLCSQATKNLYPHKLVNGLRNCTFKAILPHRPPFSIDPAKVNYTKTMLGTEELIFKILSEKEQFKVIFNYSYVGEQFSTVTRNMTAMGPMRMLQTNETDIIFGGMMMITSRAEAFTFLCGYHDYNDELRFAVSAASLVPIWKTVYIEFDFTVWILLLMSLIVYSVLIIFMLHVKDKSQVPLGLLDNLLLHGRHIRCRMTLKCILIIWVWFAYLINTFYQSSLVSLTTNPSKEYQISNEDDIVNYKLQPCYGPGLKLFISSETKNTLYEPSRSGEREGCNSTMLAIQNIIKYKDLYTLLPNYIYLYNKDSFNDKWGNSLVYYFDKPYAKFLLGFYFYKGFPISRRFQLNAMRLRENGLEDKSLNDHYFARSIKHRAHEKEFQVRLIIPWCVYVVGCVVSTITFLVEYLPNHFANRR